MDGRLLRVTATGPNARAATALLKGRLVDRRGYGPGGVLSLSSPFGDLVELWLADLDSRDLAANTGTATATTCESTSGGEAWFMSWLGVS